MSAACSLRVRAAMTIDRVAQLMGRFNTDMGDYRFPRRHNTWLLTNEGVVPKLQSYRDFEANVVEMALESFANTFGCCVTVWSTKVWLWIDSKFVKNQKSSHLGWISTTRATPRRIGPGVSMIARRVRPPPNDLRHRCWGISRIGQMNLAKC